MIKHLHMTLVVVSFLGFLARAVLQLSAPHLSKGFAIRVLPHIIDTGILLTAIYLAKQWAVSGGSHHFLSLKLMGLLGYITLGILAFRLQKRPLKILFILLACVMWGMMVYLAMHKPF